MSYDRVEKIPHRIMFFIIVAYVGLVFFPAFLNKGPLLQTDQPLWVATTHVWLKEVMPEQHWIWGSISDRAGAGIVMSGIYSAPLIIPWLISHVVSVSTAVKVSMVLCALAFIVSFYLLACMYMPRGYALLCSLTILSPVFDNLVSGMWYNYFGLACAFIFWVVSNKYRAEGGIVTFIICVLAFTLAIYSHPVGMILCFLIWFSQVFVMLRLTSLAHATNLIIFLLLPIISILLSFPQIQASIDLSDANALPDSRTVQLQITPFFETIRRTTFIRVWGATTITPLKAVIMGFNILCTFITAVLGLLYLFTRKRWDELIPIGIIGLGTFMLISRLYNAAYIFFGITLGSRFLINLSDFYPRFQLYTQFYLVLLSGVGLHFIYSQIKQKNNLVSFFKYAYIILLCSIVLIAVRVPKKLFFDKTDQLGSIQSSIVGDHAHGLWGWLRNNVNSKNERVYFENTYGKIHWNSSNNPESYKTHITALTSLYTDVCQIGGWCGFSNKFAKAHEVGGIFNDIDNIINVTDDKVAEEMKILNCRFIVSVSPPLIERLKKIEFMKNAVVFGPFHVFENVNLQPAWAYKLETGEKVEVIRHSSASYSLDVDGKKGESVHVAFAYHPNWKAISNGELITLENHKELIMIPLPQNGHHIISLSYVQNRNRAVRMCFMGAILLSVMSVILFLKKQRQSYGH